MRILLTGQGFGVFSRQFKILWCTSFPKREIKLVKVFLVVVSLKGKEISLRRH